MSELKKTKTIHSKNLPFTAGNMIIPQLALLIAVGTAAGFSLPIWVLVGFLFLIYCVIVLAAIGGQEETDIFALEPARPIITVSEYELEQFLAMPMVKDKIREIAQREAKQFDEQKHIEDWGKF